MNPRISLLALFSLAATSIASATPAEADRAEKSFQLAMDQWTQSVRSAPTAEARAKAAEAQPDATAAARQMWLAIGGSLGEEWTLDYAAWFLDLTANLRGEGNTLTFAKERDAIFAAVEAKHIQSTKLTKLCSALAHSPHPRAISLLDKIQTTNPDQKIQGVAALCYSISLKSLGDDAEIMRKRLTALRKAIIQSSDVVISGTPVSKIAEDELYIIRYLTKGRVAPDLQGIDSGGRPLKLSSQAGKVVVLMFWNSNMQDADRIVEITNRLATKFKGKPFSVIGVTNDSLEKLRALEGASTVTWPNFSDPENTLANEYRVTSLPLVYVLDGERKIQYSGTPGSFVELTAEALVAEAKPTETVAPGN